MHILLELKFSKNEILEDEFKIFLKDILTTTSSASSSNVDAITSPINIDNADNDVEKKDEEGKIKMDDDDEQINDNELESNDAENTDKENESSSETEMKVVESDKLDDNKKSRAKARASGLSRRPSNTIIRQRSNSKSNSKNNNKYAYHERTEINKHLETVSKLENRQEKLSIFERNELWLAKKVLKMEQNAKTLEKEVGTGLRRNSVGNMSRNDRFSFSSTKNNNRTRKNSGTIRRRRNNSISKTQSSINNNAKSNEENVNDNNNDNNEMEDKDLKEIIETGGICSVLSSLDETLLELSRIVGDDDDDNNVDDDKGDNSNNVIGEEEGIPAMPSEGFFTRINKDNHRGVYRVLSTSSSDINISSIYTKRDRKSGLGSAIALTVGRTMNSIMPIKERVIEVIFDITKYNPR